MFIIVTFIIGSWIGMFFMSLFSVGAYEKGFKDARGRQENKNFICPSQKSNYSQARNSYLYHNRVLKVYAKTFEKVKMLPV